MLDQNEMKNFVYFKNLILFFIFALYELTPFKTNSDSHDKEYFV